MSSALGFTRAVEAEWTKLRSVPSTYWLLLAAVASTIAFGLLVCSAVDTSGGRPGCVPGAQGCGDEDVVMNSLSGAYLGQIAVVALGVLAATSEYASGTIRLTFAATPRRSKVIGAKVAVLVGSVLVAGLCASLASFMLGQPILHTNGFVPAQGYPLVSPADAPAARAIAGTALYLGVIAVLAFAVGTIVRRAGSAIATVLAILYAPAIVSLMLADPLRGWIQKASPMMAGLAVQRTVLRYDSVPIGTWAGLGVAAAWAAVALVVALWFVRRRDA
jgi:ABC-type transport system involved in multi-copper enzyme maturation permease subunit